MYTLYYSPGACSMAIHVILEELNAEYTAKNVKNSDGSKTDEFMKVNPRGAVPTLVEDGNVIRKGAAIMIYLLEKHKSPLLPQSGKERAAALEWLMFCNATLHPAYGKLFWATKAGLSDNAKKEVFDITIKGLQNLWNDVEKNLADKPFLAGNQISAADILLTVIANWTPMICPQINFGLNTKKLLQNVTARPAFQKVMSNEGIEYKAAA